MQFNDKVIETSKSLLSIVPLYVHTSRNTTLQPLVQAWTNVSPCEERNSVASQKHQAYAVLTVLTMIHVT
jgi:hypothetical protein